MVLILACFKIISNYNPLLLFFAVLCILNLVVLSFSSADAQSK